MGVTAEEIEAALPVEAAVEEQDNFELPPSANGGDISEEMKDSDEMPADGNPEAESSGEGEASAEEAAPEGTAPEGTAPEGTEALARRTLRIQSWLIALSYLKADQLTGEYDDATRAAVVGFQEDYRLEATGECDEATYALLRDAVAALEPAPTSTEQTPTTDPTPSPTAKEIKQAQKLLVSLKYLSAEDVTGELDAATIAAILKLQADNELDETGLLDAVTLALIEKLAESEEESSESSGGKSSESSDAGVSSSSSKSSSGSATASAVSDPRLHGVTPGTALTSSHSKGAKDASRYGSVDLSNGVKALNVTLMTGDSDGALTDGAYRAQVDTRVLTLSGGDAAVQRWEFDGAALRALNRSGVDRLTLSSGSRHASLPTGGTLSGAVYEGLRARGFTDNTFVYSVTLSGESVAIAVDAQGRRYAAEEGPDGSWILSGEAA